MAECARCESALCLVCGYCPAEHPDGLESFRTNPPKENPMDNCKYCGAKLVGHEDGTCPTVYKWDCGSRGRDGQNGGTRSRICRKTEAEVARYTRHGSVVMKPNCTFCKAPYSYYCRIAHAEIYQCATAYSPSKREFRQSSECHIAQLKARVAELEASLPKTADGVAMLPGMDLWLTTPSVRCVMVIGINPSGVVRVSFHGYEDEPVTAGLHAYSTREAAKAGSTP